MKNVKKLHPAQAKMLLDGLGIELSDQPEKITEIKNLIESYQRKDPEKFSSVYTMVVDHKIPDGAEEIVVGLDAASRIVKEEVDDKLNIMISKIDKKFVDEANNLLDGMSSTFAEACERESKKYNVVQHVVKIGKAKEKKVKGVLPEYFSTLLQLAHMRKNILMVGPAGAGKTFIASKIGEALDMPYASQSCSAGVSETAFTGRLLPIKEQGTFEYVESDFVRIYEQGGVFLFDEFDAADPNVLVFLNQALANDHFYCSQRHGNTLVKKHKDFIAVAAANTFGSGGDIMYSARNNLDAATLDRFRIGTIEVDYSPAVEEEIVSAEVLQWGRNVRQSIVQNKMQKIMSTRFMKDATDMIAGQDWEMADVARMFFSDWSNEEKAVVGIHDEEHLVSRFV